MSAASSRASAATNSRWSLDRPHSHETTATTSQALVDCLRTPIDVAGISIEVGLSIGIARFPQDASEAQTLLRHADVAMYVAKKRGTPFEYYDAALDENSVRKLAIGGELRSAIAGSQLELHFQPQVNLRSGMVDSVEALVRWFHPHAGLDLASGVHRHCRVHRPHPSAHRVDARSRARPGARLARSRQCTCASR